MNSLQMYIAIAVISLAVIVLLIFRVGKNPENKRLSPMASIASGFVVAGIIFAENRLIGYGLLGIGVILAVVDIYLKTKK
jgi:hypothetical protein